MSMASAPTVIFTCQDLAIASSADMHCYAATPNPSNPEQQWQLVYYPEKDAVALLTERDKQTYALCAPPGEKYPLLRAFVWDDSYLWRVAPLGGNAGIPNVRDNGWCLTWEGPAGWKVGSKLQYWEWENSPNQKWKVTR